MCSNCSFNHIHKFDSELMWVQFDTEFTNMYIDQLVLVEKDHLNPGSISAYDLYTCKTCQGAWAYSYPANAWRGFFLPEKLAIVYEKQLKRNDRSKGFLGVLIISLILFAIFKSCTR